jgi:beta-glucosidase
MSLWLDDTTGFSVLPGDMIVYAGGQQPFQRVNVGSNVMQAKFTIT